LTVNITCSTCDGRDLCASCRTAARVFAAAGHRVEHSSRYAALRAAAAGAYGFDACVVPVASDERTIVDAATTLLGDRRLAFVMDDPAAVASAAPGATVIRRSAFDAGAFDVGWLANAPSAASLARADEPETVAMPRAQADLADERRHATRRLKRVADESRTTVATAGLKTSPRLDLLAVLDDEIAWARASEGVFALCLIHLPGLSAPRSGDTPADADRRIADAARTIATAVRSTDVISGRGDDFVVVLADADAAGARLAAERVIAAVVESALRPRAKPKARARGFAAWGVGHAAFPGDGTTRESLLARATATLKTF
jgi:GGDEF domain-containing protein